MRVFKAITHICLYLEFLKKMLGYILNFFNHNCSFLSMYLHFFSAAVENRQLKGDRIYVISLFDIQSSLVRKLMAKA